MTPPRPIDSPPSALQIFLIADVRGYTTFTQQRGDEAAAVLATRFASIAQTVLEPGGGTGLEFRGDEVMAVFMSARKAIQAAIDLQAAFVEATIADPTLPLPVGIGLDAGEAVRVKDGYRGGALNLAARLCAMAGPGEILASQGVVHLARRIDGVTQVDGGLVRLKGLAEPVRITRLTRDGWDPGEDEAFQRALGPRKSLPRSGGADPGPYRGLAAFQPEDAEWFFGREQLVADLVTRLEREPVLFVIGPSGSGKSSVVRAGLIPAVQAGRIAGSERWPVALFTPRADPLAELARQLRRLAAGVPGSGADGDEATPFVGPSEAHRLADLVGSESGRVLMVIDQFEELFTLSGRRAQERFLETLAAMIDPPDSRVRAVMAMRADFYEICATFPWLAERITANQVLVGPMSRADLRKVIEQPGIEAGLRLEEDLVDAVLEDAGDESSALPLVSHAMAETWRRRDGLTLTLAGYREAGGVAGSISKTADSLYESVFDDAEKEACRRLMLRLVTPGEGTPDTRRRLHRGELERDPNPEVSRWVVDQMVGARLLTVDRDSLEIAHEALLRSWPRLRDWIEEARDDLRTRQRIAAATAEWRAQDRDPDLLYRGTPLQSALEWAAVHGDALGPDGAEFLAASEEARRQATARSEVAARRARSIRRLAVSALGVLAIAAAGASVIAFAALSESRSAFAQALATQARLLAETDPRLAIAVAVEASERMGQDSVDARAALVNASQALAAQFVPTGPEVSVGDASTVAVSPNGSLIVTGNRDGSISTWNSTGVPLAGNVAGHALAIEEMTFTPDGRWILSGAHDGTVLVWDLADPENVPEPAVLGETTGIVWSVAVAPDGTTAASASEDGSIRLWDLESRSEIGPVWTEIESDALTVAFSPDGALLLVGDGRGEVTGWTVEDRRVAIPTFAGHASDVWEIVFSADGTRFATASSDGRIRIWETSTQEMVAEPFGRSAHDVRGVVLDGDEVLAGDETGRLLVTSFEDPGRPVSYAPRGSQIVDAALGSDTLATLGSDQQLQAWSRGGEPIARVLERHPNGAFGIAASPDGTRIATGDGDGNVRVFSVTTGERELGPIQLHRGTVWALAFSGDGSRLASGGADGEVRVIDAETGELLASPPAAGDEISSMLFVDGRLAAGGADGVVRIWDGETLAGELGPHGAGVTAVAISPGGTLAAADKHGGVALWNVEDQSAAAEPIAADDNTIWGLAWSADGAILAAASDDEVVQLWSVESRRRIGALTPHPGGAAGAAFLSDGTTIATTDRRGYVRLWDVGEAVPLGDGLTGHTAAAWRIVSLPNMRFATTSEDGTVRIWDVLDQGRACERAEGDRGLGALGDFLGEGEEPVACQRRS
ncbi:MAG TPA: AAA family ATPase [Candidatus Dormibacteraeota bacterium]|nr:AAA family ATPase [Candidatus Dormibacteraeota bacterium]